MIVDVDKYCIFWFDLSFALIDDSRRNYLFSGAMKVTGQLS